MTGVGFEMMIQRRFEAPRELVFACMTQAEHLARWWGPRSFDAPVCEVDARPGGAILIHMRGPEPLGINVIEGEFLDVSEPDRLKFVLRGFRAPDGSWGIEHVSTMIFDETADGATLMRLTTRVLQVGDDLVMALSGMKEGWSQSLDKMEELLAVLA